MTKSDLIDVLCATQKIPKGRAELLVHVIFDSMESALKRGERIEIRGFGSFELRSYRPYEGRNPRTGVRVNVQPKRLPFFKVGKELKERVNAGATAEPPAPGRGGAGPSKVWPDGEHADGTPAPAAVSSTGPLPASGASRPASESGAPNGTRRATA